MIACGGCRDASTSAPYGALDLCYACKRLAAAYCWRKLQGIEADHIRPRYEHVGSPGQAYLCILCGYWHWTSSTSPEPDAMRERVWQLARYFARVNFHINMARGWDLVRHLPREEAS